MPRPLADLVDPGHTAVLTQECQNGVIGANAALPELADVARRSMLPAIVRLVSEAHRHDVQVIHCLAARRGDGRGSNTNARLFMGVRKSPVQLLPGSFEAALVEDIPTHDRDLVSTRLHGLGPMAGTDLDPLLRNLGISTVIGVGVSVNVAITNLAMDAVNKGYQFVLPRDAVAGVPTDYADAVIDHTLSLVSTVTDVDAIVAAWAGA